MSLLRVLLSFLIVLSTTIYVNAQVDTTFICGTDPESIEDVGELIETTYTLKVLLVDFQDIRAHSPAYSFTDFNNLFFSSGVYVSPNMYSPDGQQVFGSMRDYYSIMSDGEFTLTGYVLNRDPQENGTAPEWLTLPLDKSTYDNQGFANWGLFLTDVIDAANTIGYDISTNSTTKLAIIYAGHSYRGGSLNPQAGSYGGYHLYINGELFAAGAPYRSERPDAKFSEIGINAHEFGHILGMPDLGINGFWDLMNAGTYSGPSLRGACPAPLNPQARYKKGWVDFDPVTVNQTFQSNYYLQDPEIFQITKTSDPNYYWLIETRDFNATMTIGSTVTEDYNSWMLRNFFPNTEIEKGVLIWRIKFNNWGAILQADGVRWTGYPQITEGTPYPGTGNVEVLSPWSDGRATPDWVPNTKPSLNVGTEIVGEGTDWYLIDLYVSNPEDASPSKPQNLVIYTHMNGHPNLDWEENTEPDLLQYRIYRDGEQIAITTSTFYTDNDVTIYAPIYQIDYFVKAEDTDFNLSVASETESVMGFIHKSSEDDKEKNRLPKEYVLEQNYPNPFNPTSKISYSIQKDGLVSLKVYDILGKEVASLVNEPKIAGTYNIEFNASNLPSGIYFYRIQTGTFIDTKKLILLK